MTAVFIDRDNGARARVRELAKTGSVVKVGVLGPKGAATKEGGRATVAEIAGYLHSGTEHMEARPFIAVWFDENAVENRNFARALAAERIAGRKTYDQTLQLMGLRAVGGIQKRIATGPFVPNKPSTLRRKAPKTTPLIVTGQLRSSITYEVEKL